MQDLLLFLRRHRAVMQGCVWVLGASGALLENAVAAVTAPDAGALQQQIEQSLKPAPQVQEDLQAPALKDLRPARAGALTVEVKRFVFVGNHLLSNEQLDAVVAPYVNRTLDFDQLRQVADIVANAYREAGWLVRVSLPQQEIKDGVVTLQIVEAKFGHVRLQGEQTRVPERLLKGMVERAQPAGEPVRSQRIDRALLLLDDLPGITAAGNLIEGEQAGETDLLVGAAERAFSSGNVTADNTGSRSTGTERVLASLTLNSPLRQGDQLALTALKTQGSEYQRAGFTLPVGYDGWRAGVHATRLAYGLIGDFASLNSNGSAYTTGLDASYPWLRSQATNINLTATYDAKRFDNNANGASASNYRINVYNLGVNASQMDNWGGGGMSNGGINLVSGNVNLAGSANQSTDASGPATAGGYTKLSLNLSRLQSLNNELSAYVAFNLQRASKNLDSSERLYLGGANGVRAYPGSEGGGAQGQTVTTELRQKLDAHYTLTGFYDYGRVTAFKNNAYANGSGSLNSGSGPNDYALSGYGVSLAWTSLTGTELRATLARRMGDSPIANSSTGMDGDGTKKLNRLWVSASIGF